MIKISVLFYECSISYKSDVFSSSSNSHSSNGLVGIVIWILRMEKQAQTFPPWLAHYWTGTENHVYFSAHTAQGVRVERTEILL